MVAQVVSGFVLNSLTRLGLQYPQFLMRTEEGRDIQAEGFANCLGVGEREAAVMLQNVVETLQSRLAPDHPHLAFARKNLESALLSLRGLDAEDPKCCSNQNTKE